MTRVLIVCCVSLATGCATTASNASLGLRCFHSPRIAFSFGDPERPLVVPDVAVETWLLLSDGVGQCAGLMLERFGEELTPISVNVRPSTGDSLLVTWHDLFTSSDYVVSIDSNRLSGRANGTSDVLTTLPDGTLSVSRWARTLVASSRPCPRWATAEWDAASPRGGR